MGWIDPACVHDIEYNAVPLRLTNKPVARRAWGVINHRQTFSCKAIE
jgi:hypothetical protein